MKTLHYIEGDTIQGSGGFSSATSDGFSREGLKPKIPENKGGRYDMNSANLMAEERGITTEPVREVLEYQTVSYGKPVVAMSRVFSTDQRDHKVTEYVTFPEIHREDEADVGKILTYAVNQPGKMMDYPAYMALKSMDDAKPTSEMEDWHPEITPEIHKLGTRAPEEFKLTLLYHYWQQASLRMAEDAVSSPVNIAFYPPENADEFDNPLDSAEDTIKRAISLFDTIFIGMLPKQVSHIASMACGLHPNDGNTQWNAAVQFFQTKTDLNDRQDTFVYSSADGWRIPDNYRLKDIDMEFMRMVTSSAMPMLLQNLLTAYQMQFPDATEMNTPFMADFNVWHDCFLYDRLANEMDKSLFLQQIAAKAPAKQMRQTYIMTMRLRKDISAVCGLSADKLEDVVSAAEKRLLFRGLANPEANIYDFLLENAEKPDAPSFMDERCLTDIHRRIVKRAPDDMWEKLLKILCREQCCAAMGGKYPQFFNVVSSHGDAVAQSIVPRLQQEIRMVLDSTFKPMMESFLTEGTKLDKHLCMDFFESFAAEPVYSWLSTHPETNSLMVTFLTEQIQVPGAHFALHFRGVTDRYLPSSTLCSRSFDAMCDFVKSADISAIKDSWRKTAAKDNERNPAGCRKSRDMFYLTCFKKYGRNITEQVKPLVQTFGYDNDSAIALILDSMDANEISESTIKTVFDTFAGPDHEGAGKETVDALRRLMDRKCTEMFGSNIDVSSLAAIISASGMEIDCEEIVAKFIDYGRTVRINGADLAEIFQKLPCTSYAKLKAPYAEMIQCQWDIMASSGDADLTWVTEAVKAPKTQFGNVSYAALAAKILEYYRKNNLDPSEFTDMMEALVPAGVIVDSRDFRALSDSFNGQIREQFMAMEVTKDTVDWLEKMVAAGAKYGIDVDTADFLVKIFTDISSGERWEKEDIDKVFLNLSGKNNSGAKAAKVQNAYTAMISSQLENQIKEGNYGIKWLSDMTVAARGVFQVDTSDAIVSLIRHYSESGIDMTEEDAKAIFETLGTGAAVAESKIKTAYKDMLLVGIGKMKEQGELNVDWLISMIGVSKASNLNIDTSDILVQIFEGVNGNEEMGADYAEKIFTNLGGKDFIYAGRSSVVKSYSAMLTRLEKKMIEDDAEVSGWLTDMVAAAPFSDKIDARDYAEYVTAYFDAKTQGNKVAESDSVESMLKLLPKDTTIGMENVRKALEAMALHTSDSLVENGESSAAVEWLSSIYSVCTGKIRVDMTECLKNLFRKSEQIGSLSSPSARTAFTMLNPDKKTAVTTVYGEMLEKWRSADTKDTDINVFEILCSMSEKIPPMCDDKAWLRGQHEKNTVMLCKEDDPEKMSSALHTLVSWIDSDSMSDKAMGELQRYCERHCNDEITDTVKKLSSSFRNISASSPNLRKFVTDNIKEEYQRRLRSSKNGRMSAVIEGMDERLRNVGSNMDELFDSTEETDRFIARFTDGNSDVALLEQELSAMPEGSKFFTVMKERIENSLAHKQEEMFQNCQTISAALEMQDKMRSISTLSKGMECAFKVLEIYPEGCRRILSANEQDIAQTAAEEVSKVSRMVKLITSYASMDGRSGENMTKAVYNLCTKEQPDEKGMGFRQVCAAAIMKEALNGEINWAKVVKAACDYTKTDVKNAGKNPFARKNMPLVMAVISLNELVDMMDREKQSEGWREKWEEALKKQLSPMLSAMKADRKNQDRYGILLTGDGIPDIMRVTNRGRVDEE